MEIDKKNYIIATNINVYWREIKVGSQNYNKNKSVTTDCLINLH